MLRLAVLLMVTWIAAPAAAAQELVAQYVERGPRFFLASAASSSAPARVDVTRTPSLRRQISLDLDGVPLPEALRTVSREGGVQLAFSQAVLPANRTVHFRAESITVAAALTELLLDAQVDILFSRDGRGVLVRRQEGSQTGSIAGLVTDGRSETPLPGTTVWLEDTRHSAIANSEGRYHIADVPPGSYTVRARYIGFRPAVAQVTVVDGETAAVDFALEKSAQQLEEVVTTGTVVATEVKALPNPITVIDAEQISTREARTTTQVLRQFVPGMVAWSLDHNQYQTTVSVRGASTLDYAGSAIKTYVDGVQVANATFAAVDPGSIDHIEVVRGPQAATLYGSDAIGGVMQVFTKRGESGPPQVALKAGVGPIQTDYGSSALRQEYAASVRGGAPGMNYLLGGTYTHNGDWVPEGRSSLPSFFGRVSVGRDRLTVDLSGRYYVQNTWNSYDPRVYETGYVPLSGPLHQPADVTEYGVSARLGYAAAPRWSHTLVLGMEGSGFDQTQTQPTQFFPADTFLSVFTRDTRRTSINYNTTYSFDLAEDVGGNVTAGLDRYDILDNFYQASRALTGEGVIASDPAVSPYLSRGVGNNTGLFAQVQLALWDALFLTGGLRAERGSAFDGTDLSPRVGGAYTHDFGDNALKLRASYGEAIQPPSLSAMNGGFDGYTVTLANLGLTPSRQRGWDAGLDFILGGTGKLSLTYYDQTAEDLIQYVYLDTDFTQAQYQNVGRVKNTGFEAELAIGLGPKAELSGQFSYARSRIDELGPDYGGDLEVGDQALTIPRYTGGASLSVRPGGSTNLVAGITYVGDFTALDALGIFSCNGGTGPCSDTFRGYHLTYPGYVKANFSVRQRLTSQVTAYVAMDNVTGSDGVELQNSVPVMGRVTVAGLEARF